MDITSASPSHYDAARISTNVSHPPTGTSQVTSPMYGSTSSREITAAIVPIVQSTLADHSFQPSVLVFGSGIAFDYYNFPRIVSVSWPVFNIESGMSTIARDGPERSLTHIPTNETITFHNDVPPSVSHVFTWVPPQSESAKEPVISTAEKTAPVGITIPDPGEIQTELITRNTNKCVKSTSKLPEKATTFTHMSLKQGSCYGIAESTTLKKVEISEEKHLQENSFDKVQLNAIKEHSDSEEATITEDLEQKRTRTKPVQVTLWPSADNKQSEFKAQEMFGPVHYESEKSDHECRCIQSKERPDVKDCEHDTVASSKESKVLSSSEETKRVEEDNSGCKATPVISTLDVTSNLRAADDAPIIKEDNSVSTTNKTDHLEDSYVFCSSPPRQSDSGSNHSTVSVQQCKEDKQENVRDLITRIKYIKSRLDRAESDHRKKRMLKAIICLQKRAKALVKGMKKEKVDPSKGQKETSSYKEGLPCQELGDNTELGSHGTSTTSRALPNNHLVKDQGDVSLLLDVKQASNDSSKGISGRENQQSCKELSVVSPPVIIANHDDNNDTRSETRTADEFDSKNFRHSRDGDLNIENNNNNIKRREERGSLSLITPNGSVDEVSLRLPLGIGLDHSPCRKRAALSSELDENDLQDDQSFQAKKKKRLSLSDEDVKKIDPRSENVTQHIESVTQDSALKDSEFNERNEGANNVECDEASASGNDECDLLIRKEFGLGDEDSVTVFSSMGAAQGISVEHNKEVPLNSTIEDNVQAEENNRKANEGIGKDRTTVCDGLKIIDDAASFNCYDYKSNGDAEMNEIQEHNSCSEEMQCLASNSVMPLEDNSSEEEEKYRGSLLERVLQEQETQGFTSPAIHNPSGRQEDVDLTQSLQIREARILNLTRKRDRLLNLTGFKKE